VRLLAQLVATRAEVAFHLHKADRDLRADGKKIRTEAAQK